MFDAEKSKRRAAIDASAPGIAKLRNVQMLRRWRRREGSLTTTGRNLDGTR